MGKCVIFCAGGFEALAEPIGQTDIVLCADGGLLHAQRLGICPTEILGDFDSLGFVPPGAAVFPVEKDDTDAMLAVKRGLSLGCTEFLLYGAMDGGRIDHTVAAFQTLQYLADRGAVGYLAGLGQTATVIQGETLTFPAHWQGVISLFCMGAQAEVTIEDLHYPLSRGSLSPGFPLGVSNHFIGKQARITLHKGSLLAIWDNNPGFPGRERVG